MKRLALASVALIALGGASYAQERGNFSNDPQAYHSGGYRYDGDRYHHGDRYKRAYRSGSYYAGGHDPYYRPYRHHRRHYERGPGFSFSFGGPGWRVGVHDHWR
ncbi:MAG: hypothetical protein AB7I79_04690 [Rhizobiaceae bacterium]